MVQNLQAAMQMPQQRQPVPPGQEQMNSQQMGQQQGQPGAGGPASPGSVQGQKGAQVPTSMSGVVMSQGGPVGGMQVRDGMNVRRELS